MKHISGYQRFTHPPEDMVIYAIGGTAFVVSVAVIAVALLLRKNRLNWYERNLLEIAESQPEFVRHKIKRQATSDTIFDEETESQIASGLAATVAVAAAPLPGPMRHQSRLHFEDKPSASQNAPFFKPTAAPAEDVSEKFMVPRAHTHTASMFRNLEKGQIDRTLYDYRQDSCASADEPIMCLCGSLNLSLHYDPNLSLLTVRLRQAADLIGLRTDGPPNPYCRVTLAKPEPNGHPVTQQSKIYRKTRSPEMDDEFCFDVPAGQISNCKLEVLLYDFDQCSVDECIGYCWLSLNRLDVSHDKDNPTTFWAEILPVQRSDEGFGEILFSITYLSKAQRLTVNIFKARHLVAPDTIVEMPAPCVRVTLVCSGKRLKKKKTATRKSTLHPIYNEALTFNVPKASLCDIVLEIEVVHETGTFGMGTKVLGRLDLPLHKCKDLWRAMIHGENTQAKWYALEGT